MFKRLDGFDHYVAVGHAATGTAAYLQAAGYLLANIATNNFAVIAGADGVGAALRMTMTGGSSTPPTMTYSMTSEQNLVVFGFYMRGTGAHQRVCRINNIIDLDWDSSTGKFRIGGVQGANVIVRNAWWYVEVEIDKAAQEVRVWANDVLQLTVPLTGATSNTFSITWGMTSAPEATGTIDIDDFYALDSDPLDLNGGATANISRRGPMVITTRQPTMDVETGWTIVGSQAPTHYTIAAQLDPGRANAPYLQANIDGITDKYQSNVVLPNDNQVFAVAMVSYARKGDLDNRELGMVVSTDGGETEIRVPLTENFLYHQRIAEKAPGNVDWNRNRVESSNFGPRAR